jgi:hypothetical protein
MQKSTAERAEPAWDRLHSNSKKPEKWATKKEQIKELQTTLCSFQPELSRPARSLPKEDQDVIVERLAKHKPCRSREKHEPELRELNAWKHTHRRPTELPPALSQHYDDYFVNQDEETFTPEVHEAPGYVLQHRQAKEAQSFLATLKASLDESEDDIRASFDPDETGSVELQTMVEALANAGMEVAEETAQVAFSYVYGQEYEEAEEDTISEAVMPMELLEKWMEESVAQQEAREAAKEAAISTDHLNVTCTLDLPTKRAGGIEACSKIDHGLPICKINKGEAAYEALHKAVHSMPLSTHAVPYPTLVK